MVCTQADLDPPSKSTIDIEGGRAVSSEPSTEPQSPQLLSLDQTQQAEERRILELKMEAEKLALKDLEQRLAETREKLKLMDAGIAPEGREARPTAGSVRSASAPLTLIIGIVGIMLAGT